MNLAESFTGTAEACGQRFRKWDDVWAADRKLGDPLGNSATLLRPVAEDGAEDLTARLDVFFAETGSPWLLWSAWPTPDLSALGYQDVGAPPLMVRRADAPRLEPPPELRIEEVRDETGLADFERTFIAGYPLHGLDDGGWQLFGPGAIGGPMRFWVGYTEDEPVTVATSCAQSGVVGVYYVATMESARGKGYGAAITDVAARCEPSRPALLQSSDLGRPVYERLGFKEVARYHLWLKSGK